MPQTMWDGQDLVNLVTKNKKELLELYPDHTWVSLKAKRTLKRRHLREGKLSLPATEDGMPETEKILKLKSRNNELQRQLDMSRERTLDYIAALRTAWFESIEDLKIIPPTVRRIDPDTTDWGDRQEETAVMMVSDLQLGKRTSSYDSDVCAVRMRTLAEKAISLAAIQNSHHPVKNLHLQLLGDIVEGEGIFPGQAHQIDSGLFRQHVNGQRILTQLILDLLTYFDTIHVVAVIGNHGQVRLRNGDTDPETNMDRLLYQVVATTFENEPRVTFDIPQGAGNRNWFAIDKVYEWGFLMAHGDQVRGWGGIPFYGALKKAFGWIDTIDAPWDYLHLAHHHTPTMMTLNRRIVRFNGTTESDNEYAQEQLAAGGHPTQWLGFVHPSKGVTSEYWVALEDKKPNVVRYREYGARTSVNGL